MGGGEVLKTDSRRRVTLPSHILEGDEEFVAVKVREGILLYRLPKDPVATLRSFGEKLKGKSLRRLRKEAEELATEEALDGLRR